MTVKEAYERALALDGCTVQMDDTMRDKMVHLTNLFLAETWENENQIRIDEHARPLANPAEVKRIEDTIPYSYKLIASALPFWLAHQILREGDDNAWASRYYDMYLNAVQSATPILRTPLLDVWR